jgi:hypothetical protein
MTKSEIRQTLIGCAAQLKHIPSLEEFLKMSPVSHRQIVKHFGGYIGALRATGLELKSTIGRGHSVPMDKLFTDWAGIVQKLKKVPSIHEYQLFSQYSCYPLMRQRKQSFTRGFARMNADQKQTQFAVSCVPITRSRAITRSPDLHHWACDC